ncbi:hypothetical protein MA16_Dca021785 [Dendrobium catenatum]|uniref:Uncharacterized protein n=1 Tax=Dendrobium catenatum TaxID=906689 RepID=A0A2I0WXU6_9ASPA|nr:hypothetical protein MA16_Dca021785 [Dendrobium catenatum]
MVDKSSEGVTKEPRWRPVEAVKNSTVEDTVFQTRKNIEDLETKKVQSQKTLVNSTMEINEANGMTIKSSNIVSENKFNILDGLVVEGEIVFSVVVDINLVEDMNGLRKVTEVNFKSNIEELKEVIDMK